MLALVAVEFAPRPPAAPREARSRRGGYDRHSSPSERIKRQREELLAAVRQCVAEGEPLSVAGIVARRGMGRKTFYEHFVSVEEALEAATAAAEELVRVGLQDALRETFTGTPSDYARVFVERILDASSTEREAWTLLRSGGPTHALRVLERAMAELYEVYVEAGAAARGVDPLVLRAAAGALLALLDPGVAQAAPEQRAQLSTFGVNVLNRLLR